MNQNEVVLRKTNREISYKQSPATTLNKPVREPDSYKAWLKDLTDVKLGNSSHVMLMSLEEKLAEVNSKYLDPATKSGKELREYLDHFQNPGAAEQIALRMKPRVFAVCEKGRSADFFRKDRSRMVRGLND